MCQADPVRLGYEAEEVPIAVEAPGSALLDDLKARFIITVEKCVGNLAAGVLESQLERIRTEPLYGYDRNLTVREDAANSSVGLKVFEPAHSRSAMASTALSAVRISEERVRVYFQYAPLWLPVGDLVEVHSFQGTCPSMRAL